MQRQRSWNLFARELEAILAKRGLGIGHLDNRAFIHPEKVRRLQRSLREPKFHVLPPEEIDRICTVFQFTPQEVMRLKAAILATAIEVMLMNRINQDDALAAAEQFLPLLQRALETHDGDADAIGQIKSIPEAPASAESVTQQLEHAIETLDIAVLLLHAAGGSMAGGSEHLVEQKAYTRSARANFLAAQASLERFDAGIQQTETWRAWHDESLKGAVISDR